MQSTTSVLSAMMQRHMALHTTAGYDWPATAQFAAHYNMSTWPCGWGKESDVVFFDTREQLDAWVDDKRDWATLEDNEVCFRVYEWDLGPVLMEEFAHYEFPNCFPPSYQQKLKGL